MKESVLIMKRQYYLEGIWGDKARHINKLGKACLVQVKVQLQAVDNLLS